MWECYAIPVPFTIVTNIRCTIATIVKYLQLLHFYGKKLRHLWLLDFSKCNWIDLLSMGALRTFRKWTTNGLTTISMYRVYILAVWHNHAIHFYLFHCDISLRWVSRHHRYFNNMVRRCMLCYGRRRLQPYVIASFTYMHVYSFLQLLLYFWHTSKNISMRQVQSQNLATCFFC